MVISITFAIAILKITDVETISTNVTEMDLLNIVIKFNTAQSVRIQSYSAPYFFAFGLNTERYEVSVRVQSKCGKMWTRITPDKDTFHVVQCFHIRPVVATKSPCMLFYKETYLGLF